MNPEYWFNLRNKSEKFEVAFSCRKASNFWGRFGGGWQLKLGIQASKSTVIISLLVAELRISWYGMTKAGKEYYARRKQS
jgi:hypothetical protein